MHGFRSAALLLLVLTSCVRSEVRGGPGAIARGPAVPPSATLRVRVRDALTGKPVERCNLVGTRSAGQVQAITPSADDVATDGVHRYEISPLVGRVRLAAEGYRETWSDDVRLSAGETKDLLVDLEPLGRLVVAVSEDDGAPVASGTLLLTGPDLEATSIVKAGVADGRIDAGEITIVVDPEFMPGYAPQARLVVVRPGERTDVRLQVTRR